MSSSGDFVLSFWAAPVRIGELYRLVPLDYIYSNICSLEWMCLGGKKERFDARQEYSRAASSEMGGREAPTFG
jgi:hypothetical protein